MKYGIQLFFLLFFLSFACSCLFITMADKNSNFIITGNKHGFGLSKDIYRDGKNADSLLAIETWPLTGKDSFLYDAESKVIQIRYFDTKNIRTYKKVNQIPAIDSPAIVQELDDYRLLGVFEANDLPGFYSCIYLSPRKDVLEIVHNGNIGSPVMPFFWLKNSDNPVAGKPEMLKTMFKQWTPVYDKSKPGIRISGGKQ